MADFRCPKCDKKLFEYYGKISYGYMIRECKKCGAKYVDPRIMEMALTGIPASDFNINSYIFVIAIGIFMIYRAYDLFGMEMLGAHGMIQYVTPSIMLIGGIAFIIIAIFEIISIKTGGKIKRYQKKYNESLRRLKNPAYITELHMLGYSIPKDIKQRIIYEREIE